MKILFCKIASMKYYKSICADDLPINGGEYVKQTGYGHEEINFMPIPSEDGKLSCYGFFEPKSRDGRHNSVHIERIVGCGEMKHEPYCGGVLVVWCATRLQGDVTVVGWYKNARVFRHLQEWTLEWDNGESEERMYNVIAQADDCVLLPEGERNRHVWSVPSARYTRSYGFGQAMVWYPTEEAAQAYLDRLLTAIDAYDGENWLDKYPE